MYSQIEGVPMLKLRLVDCRATNFNSAIISIWRPNEELQHHLKEGRAYHLYNVNAAGLRFGELQLNAMKNTMWKDMKQPHPTPVNFSTFSGAPYFSYFTYTTLQSLDRSVIAFSAANLPGFKPMFNELDIVGLVVFVGHQQSKGPFQTTILFDGYFFCEILFCFDKSSCSYLKAALILASNVGRVWRITLWLILLLLERSWLFQICSGEPRLVEPHPKCNSLSFMKAHWSALGLSMIR